MWWPTMTPSTLRPATCRSALASTKTCRSWEYAPLCAVARHGRRRTRRPVCRTARLHASCPLYRASGGQALRRHEAEAGARLRADGPACRTVDRKSVVWEKSVSERVDIGGRRVMKNKKKHINTETLRDNK